MTYLCIEKIVLRTEEPETQQQNFNLKTTHAQSVSITWVLVLEAINLGLWFYVLAARLIAGISGKTRSWFWLAWGPQATGASGGRCPVVPLAAAPATNQNQ